MRILQIIAGFCMVTFPYFLVYHKFGLKENFNNPLIFRSTLFYSLLTVGLKVLLMATGVPELLARFLLPEKLVLSLLDTVSLVGIRFALSSKPALSVRHDVRVLSVGLWWSFVNSFVRCLNVSWRVQKAKDYTNLFFFFALNANLSVVASITATCLTLMFTVSKYHESYYPLIGGYVLVYPVLSIFSFNEDSDVNVVNVAVFVVQAALGLAFSLYVKHHYLTKFKQKK